jgi:hypothetical protein
VVPDDWKEAVADADTGLVERIPYELCAGVAAQGDPAPGDLG